MAPSRRWVTLTDASAVMDGCQSTSVVRDAQQRRLSIGQQTYLSFDIHNNLSYLSLLVTTLIDPALLVRINVLSLLFSQC